MRTHVDLFSGIGGFALAAKACGVQTVSFCEIDRRCRDFLDKAWPGVEINDDIKTFKGEKHHGIWLLSAGVPCQPASRAGEQRGKADNRWLWPEAIRVLGEVQPTWALFENPPGIGDVGLAGILADVETKGYETRVFSIPACAIGAPHRRERYWILAHTTEQGRKGANTECESDGCGAERNKGNVGNAKSERGGTGPCQSKQKLNGIGPAGTSAWSHYVQLPCADGKLRRAPDDSFGLVNGLHRSLLGALGNSIVPQIAEKIIWTMIEAES